MAPRMSKRKHQGSQKGSQEENGNAEKPKGAGGRGRSPEDMFYENVFGVRLITINISRIAIFAHEMLDITKKHSMVPWKGS